MNTKQIWQALTNNPDTEKYFDGVFSYDTLGGIRRRPKLVISNTDPSYRKGEHWVLFFFNDDGSVDFFDSLGNDPGYYGVEFEKIIKRFSNYYYIVNTPIQKLNSNLCGFYCLWYSYWKCINTNNKMEKILKNVPTNNKLKDIVGMLFEYCKRSNCRLLQSNMFM